MAWDDFLAAQGAAKYDEYIRFSASQTNEEREPFNERGSRTGCARYIADDLKKQPQNSFYLKAADEFATKYNLAEFITDKIWHPAIWDQKAQPGLFEFAGIPFPSHIRFRSKGIRGGYQTVPTDMATLEQALMMIEQKEEVQQKLGYEIEKEKTAIRLMIEEAHGDLSRRMGEFLTRIKMPVAAE